MNINLKELAEQAGWYHAVTSGDYIFSEVQAEKFAKLIVRECSVFIDTEISIGSVCGQGLLDHFGINE